MVDSFTRFKAACFINNKKGETVVEALLLNWVKFFSAPTYIQSDQAFCNIHGIQMTTIASFTPNPAGLMERNHAVIDKMVEKMLTQDNKLKPEVASDGQFKPVTVLIW